MSNWKKYVLLFIAVFAMDAVFSQGCSQCKLLAEQGSELDEASFGSNINYGILYLMTIPYILLLILFRKRIIRLFRALLER
ncbi:MAG: hypothetical protein QNL61_05870 [Crocinitomicaceae bacterium]